MLGECIAYPKGRCLELRKIDNIFSSWLAMAEVIGRMKLVTGFGWKEKIVRVLNYLNHLVSREGTSCQTGSVNLLLGLFTPYISAAPVLVSHAS